MFRPKGELREIEELWGFEASQGTFLIAAALIGSALAGVAGSVINSDASSTAAGQQTKALGQGINTLNTNQTAVNNNLSPYLNLGTSTVLPALQSQISASGAPLPQSLNPLTPFSPSDLSQTPGYNFTLQQGLKGVQNSYAAQGLGSSGAAEKGAADYTTGLAQNTYNQQLQNYLNQQNQQFNQGYQINAQNLQQRGINNSLLLGALSGTQGTALGEGQLDTQNSQAIANLLAGVGNANAAGTVGSANAISGGISNVGNLATQYGIFNLLNGGGTGMNPFGTSNNSSASANYS